MLKVLRYIALNALNTVQMIKAMSKMSKIDKVHIRGAMLCMSKMSKMGKEQTDTFWLITSLILNGFSIQKKVLESWDLGLFKSYVYWRLLWSPTSPTYTALQPLGVLDLSPTSPTCFNIHSIWWYGWKALSHSFPKLFSDWKSIKEVMSQNVSVCSFPIFDIFSITYKDN